MCLEGVVGKGCRGMSGRLGSRDIVDGALISLPSGMGDRRMSNANPLILNVDEACIDTLSSWP